MKTRCISRYFQIVGSCVVAILTCGGPAVAASISCGQTISAPGTYTLDQDLYCGSGTGLTITGPSPAGTIIIDGAGKSLKGRGCGKDGMCIGGTCSGGPFASMPSPLNQCGSVPGNSIVGIRLTASGVTIKSIKLMGFYDGIELRNADNNTLEGVNAIGNGTNNVGCNSAACGYGIELTEDSDNNTLLGVQVGNNGDEGIHISDGSNNNTITNLPISGCSPLASQVWCSGRENIYILEADDNDVEHIVAHYDNGCVENVPLSGKKVSVNIEDSDGVEVRDGTFRGAPVRFVGSAGAGGRNILKTSTVDAPDVCVRFNQQGTNIPAGNEVRTSTLTCADNDDIRVSASGSATPKNKICATTSCGASCSVDGDPNSDVVLTEAACFN